MSLSWGLKNSKIENFYQASCLVSLVGRHICKISPILVGLSVSVCLCLCVHVCLCVTVVRTGHMLTKI